MKGGGRNDQLKLVYMKAWRFKGINISRKDKKRKVSVPEKGHRVLVVELGKEVLGPDL